MCALNDRFASGHRAQHGRRRLNRRYATNGNVGGIAKPWVEIHGYHHNIATRCREMHGADYLRAFGQPPTSRTLEEVEEIDLIVSSKDHE